MVKWTKKKLDSGIALVLVLALLLVATIVLVVFTQRGSGLLRVMGIKLRKTQTDYMAEDALERGFLKIKRLVELDPVVQPPVEVADFDGDVAASGEGFLGNATYEYAPNQTPGAGYQVRYRVTSSSDWQRVSGVNPHYFRRYTVYAHSRGPGDAQTLISQDLIVRRQPLYNYAVFANDNLEMNFSGNATIRGRIHSNKNVFIENGLAGTFFDIIGSLSAAGHIIRNNLSGLSSGTGSIRISWDPLSSVTPTQYASLTANTSSGPVTGGTGTDAISYNADFLPNHLKDPTREASTAADLGTINPDTGQPRTWTVDPRWITETKTKFNDRVQDGSHGVGVLQAPNVREVDPTGYYADQADVHILTTPVDATHVQVSVTKGAGPPVAVAQFDVGDTGTGNAEVYDGGAPPASEYDPTAAGAAGRTDKAITCAGDICRGPGAQTGTLVSGSQGCADAFKQERVWSSHEDRFVLNTQVDVRKLQLDCVGSDMGTQYRVYATREDAVPDGTITETGEPDPDRKPYGYVLTGGAKLEAPLFFVTNNPVTVRGDFNKHQDDKGNSLNPYDASYDPDQDLWWPAAIIADRFTAQSDSYSVPYNNRFRRVMGGKREFNPADTSAPGATPLVVGANAMIPKASPLEIGAAIIAGESPTIGEYTKYSAEGYSSAFFADQLSAWNSAHPSEPLPGVQPKGTGGFAKYLRVEEDFTDSGTYMKFWGTFIKLFPSRFATMYSGRECPSYTSAAMSNGQSGVNVCGAWAPGGVGGSVKTDRRSNRTYNYDPRFEGDLPPEFVNMFPAAPTDNPLPYERTNFQRLEPVPPNALF